MLCRLIQVHVGELFQQFRMHLMIVNFSQSENNTQVTHLNWASNLKVKKRIRNGEDFYSTYIRLFFLTPKITFEVS